jgi:hypothetical protein
VTKVAKVGGVLGASLEINAVLWGQLDRRLAAKGVYKQIQEAEERAAIRKNDPALWRLIQKAEEWKDWKRQRWQGIIKDKMRKLERLGLSQREMARKLLFPVEQHAEWWKVDLDVESLLPLAPDSPAELEEFILSVAFELEMLAR